MGAPKGSKNGIPYDSERAREAGKKSKRPKDIKTIVKAILQRKLNGQNSPEYWKQLQERLGLPEGTDTIEGLLEALAIRGIKNDASLKMFLELGGMIKPEDTSQLPQLNIQIGFDDKSQS
jgi:hypothetical protein